MKIKIPFNNFHLQSNKLKKQYLTAINRVINSNWYILGDEVKKFEAEFAKYLGAKYCIGVANGLEALQIALMSLNISTNDEVITTPLSAVATTLAILAVGAKPVFVDINDRGLIDASLIKAAVTKKTKAILPVHLYGNAAELKQMKKICRQKKLYLIEDAAQAHGSKYFQGMVGSIGDIGCFSFYPTKNLGAIGDGGAIVTNNPKLAKICQQIRDYGQSSKYIHSVYGLNSRLDELQAAILRVKLKKLTTDNQRRQRVFAQYKKHLTKLPQIRLIDQIPETQGNHHILAILTQKRNQLKQYLIRLGIETLIHYPLSIPDQPFFQTHRFKPAKVTWWKSRTFVRQVLSLPCYPELSNVQVKFICQAIADFFQATL